MLPYCVSISWSVVAISERAQAPSPWCRASPWAGALCGEEGLPGTALRGYPVYLLSILFVSSFVSLVFVCFVLVKFARLSFSLFVLYSLVVA